MTLEDPYAAKPEDKPVTEQTLLEQLKVLHYGDEVVKRATAAPKDKGQNQTEITAQEATFEEKAHTAVFLRDVFVDNPEFNVNCDKLTAYLKHNDDPNNPNNVVTPTTQFTTGPKPSTPSPVAPKATPKGARGAHATTVKASPTPKPGAAPAKPGDPDAAPAQTGGLDKAVAEGNVLITQDKVEADGTLSHNIGHAKKAFYDANTGDISLYGKPDASRGVNTVVALVEETVIVLNRDGRMKVFGPHKTTIKDSGGDNTASNGH
jgi:lipopolysaccharide export system protein LptA